MCRLARLVAGLIVGLCMVGACAGCGTGPDPSSTPTQSETHTIVGMPSIKGSFTVGSTVTASLAGLVFPPGVHPRMLDDGSGNVTAMGKMPWGGVGWTVQRVGLPEVSVGSAILPIDVTMTGGKARLCFEVSQYGYYFAHWKTVSCSPWHAITASGPQLIYDPLDSNLLTGKPMIYGALNVGSIINPDWGTMGDSQGIKAGPSPSIINSTASSVMVGDEPAFFSWVVNGKDVTADPYAQKPPGNPEPTLKLIPEMAGDSVQTCFNLTQVKGGYHFPGGVLQSCSPVYHVVASLSASATPKATVSRER